MTVWPRKDLSRQILSIAGPAVAGLASQMIVSIVDTAMVGRLPNTHIVLAAMGLGLLATWAITSLFSSLSTGTHVMVARRHGERNYEAAGEVLRNSLALCLLLGIVFGVTGFIFSFDIIDFFAKDDRVAEAGASYMQYRFLGLPFFLLIVSYRGFFYGIGNTKVFMLSAIIINVLNIILNYLLIFGALGFPRLELAGAGLASSISTAVGCMLFVFASLMNYYKNSYRYYAHFNIKRDVLGRLIKISLPVSTQNILILIGFLIFIAITGIIGTTEQAATQVVITALFMSFMPCFGLGIAAQTLVGQSLGRGTANLAQAFGFETAKLGTIFTALVGLIFVLVPDAVLIIITTNKEVIDVARPILRLAGVAQLFYGAGVILANSLQASGATLFVMFVDVLTHWVIFLPLAYLLGITLDGGIIGAWLALPAYIVLYTSANYLKFRSLGWRQLNV